MIRADVVLLSSFPPRLGEKPGSRNFHWLQCRLSQPGTDHLTTQPSRQIRPKLSWSHCDISGHLVVIVDHSLGVYLEQLPVTIAGTECV